MDFPFTVCQRYMKKIKLQKSARAFAEQRQKWKNHLNSISLLIKPGRDEKYTNQELFNILRYDSLAHQDKKYINEFLMLTKQGAFVFAFFLSSLNTILNIVNQRPNNLLLCGRLSASAPRRHSLRDLWVSYSVLI